MTLSVIALLRVLAASQVVLTIAGLVFASNNPPRTKLILLCLGLGALGYFIEPLISSTRLQPLVLVFANAIPLFLWATCRIFFNDDAALPRRTVIVAALTLGLMITGAFRAPPPIELGNAEFVMFRLVPQIIKLGFVILAIHVSWVGMDADLLEPRRRARRWFALGLGIMVAIVIATEIITVFQVPRELELAGMMIMFALTIGLNLLFFNVDPAFELQPAAVPASPTAVLPADDPLLAGLQRLMVDERAYADHDLRIGGLARRLGTAEHRLRAAINGKLGYRNFNQYVNGYRISEAARRLISEPDLPVLSIALDVGFRSLSVFNQAFRNAEGCTPTEFRSRGGRRG